jgi:glycosyltransferase involved in cell wall biosynthesis
MHVVLLATDPSEAHGWSNHARELIGALAAHGVQLTLITSRHAAARDLPNTTIQRCLPSLSEPSRALSLRLLAANWLVQRVARQADLLHVLAEPYALAALTTSKPCLVTAHGTYLLQTAQAPLFGKLYRHVYRRAQIICVSRYTERRVRAILPDVRTHVIPNGVNLARFAQPSGVSVPKRAPTVLSVGQIKPRKGFLEIAEAMALVRGQIPEAEAVSSATHKAIQLMWRACARASLRSAWIKRFICWESCPSLSFWRGTPLPMSSRCTRSIRDSNSKVLAWSILRRARQACRSSARESAALRTRFATARQVFWCSKAMWQP